MANLAERRKDMLHSMMREGIYEAAVEIINLLGSDGLTMDRLAEKAGIAKGSLYNYFANKHELIVFIYNRTIEPAGQAVDEIIAKPISADKKLGEIVRLLFNHFTVNHGIFDFLFNDPEIRAIVEPLKRASCRTDILRQLSKVFQQGMEEGTFRKLIPNRAAEMFFGALTGSFEHELISGEDRSSEEATGVLLDFFFKGLQPRD